MDNILNIIISAAIGVAAAVVLFIVNMIWGARHSDPDGEDSDLAVSARLSVMIIGNVILILVLGSIAFTKMFPQVSLGRNIRNAILITAAWLIIANVLGSIIRRLFKKYDNSSYHELRAYKKLVVMILNSIPFGAFIGLIVAYSGFFK